MPVVDAVASEYQGDVAFVAVAGRSTLGASRAMAPLLFDEDRIFWGYDDSVWSLFGVRGQPVTFVIDAEGRVVDQWFGIRSESDIRSLLDGVLAST